MYRWTNHPTIDEAFTLFSGADDLLYVAPHFGTGRLAWAIYTPDGAQVGGLEATVEAARTRAVRVALARELESRVHDLLDKDATLKNPDITVTASIMGRTYDQVAADLEAAHFSRVATLALQESERQMIILALAALAVQRPGWLDVLERLALRFDPSKEMFQRFVALKVGPPLSDDFKPPPAPGRPL
jgi:hypothetical protein